MLLNHRYRTIEQLGEGGFGKTYLAQDTQMPSGRYCVIKQLKPMTDREASPSENRAQIYQLVKERFQREAAILENLGTSNSQIPTLYAYFQENDLFYLVQELIEGETLSQKMNRSGPMSESTVKSFLADILPVFDFIHARGIVHRDVKPDNIVIRASDNFPILIDFGAVRETMATSANLQGNSSRSIVIGTPGFMPNEQAAGRPVFSSDLYALGLTAIYLLTKQFPPNFPTEPHTGEILWRQSAPNVSQTLANVLDRAIASHPRDRFSSAKEMLAALQEQPVNLTPLASTVVVNLIAPPPTIPVSNSSNSSPSNSPGLPTAQPASSMKPMLLAGAIAGGLIGISIIVGLSFTGPKETVIVRSTREYQNPSQTTTETSPSTPTPVPEASNPVPNPSPAIDNSSSTPPVSTPQTPQTNSINPAIPSPAPSSGGWEFVGYASTEESVYVDRGSIQKSGKGINFKYQIGKNIVSATADCQGDRWYAEGYDWYSPQSPATQNMLAYVCQF